MDRLTIARTLRDGADALALSGSEPFRARAYARGARVLERLDDRDFTRLLSEGRLTRLAGIGRGLAAAITELARDGRSETIEKLRRGLPGAALELGRVPHLGLKKIAALEAALGVTSVAQLEAACEAGRVRGVKGFGEKTERQILEAIRGLEPGRSTPEPIQMLLPEALDIAGRFLRHVRATPGVSSAEVAGDLRRWTETVDRLVVVLASRTPDATLGRVMASPLLVSAGARAGLTGRGTLITGAPVEIHAAPPDRLAAILLRATGSPGHWRDLTRAARAHDVDLARAVGEDEAQIYRRLGLPWITPELREGTGEVEAAEAGELPGDLVTRENIRGLVHCHTVYSDGRHTIAEMARAADALGMAYLTITDHSPTAFYANGLAVDRLKAQWEEIARVQESVAVRLLRGTESDILADGALDYPDAVLEQLDVVIASIHARHRMDADRMTARIIRAMRHPCFKIWGHALGRLLRSRPPIPCRVEEVLDVIAESRAAIEINGDPHRLDLAPPWLRAARERGIPFVVSTDAHATGELRNVRYGTAMARRGWVRRSEVLNTMDAERFARAVSPTGARVPA